MPLLPRFYPSFCFFFLFRPVFGFLVFVEVVDGW